jgi:hypothetical protein
MKELILEYEGKQYKVPDDGWGEFSWTDGNMGCDCNRSKHIKMRCDPNFPELPCGDKIKLLNPEILL